MLVALSIRSFVLIDSLDLEAANGFTALTGETGAGKSIILDALSLVLGGAVNRKQIRAGAEQASLTAEFGLPVDHPIWNLLDTHGIQGDREETLLLRRIISRKGPSRAFVNGQPVAASVLAELGEHLVEIHGQHSASRLMRPSTHLDLLDCYAGHEKDVEACKVLWQAFETRHQERLKLEAAVQSAHERRDWLAFAVEDLSKLAPEPGEVETLTTQRSALLQSERVTEAVDEASVALRDVKLEESLSKAARATGRVLRVPGLEILDGDVYKLVSGASDAIERTLIELAEAQTCVNELTHLAGHDSNRLEVVEERLFGLRAAARKYDCLPELLSETLEKCRSELSLCDADTQALDAAKELEAETRTAWQTSAKALSASRQKHACLLEQAIVRELEPLHLGKVKLRVCFTPLVEGQSGAKGLERAEFEIETNPGAGFGPLKAIASGGELARFSLALKCALSQSGGVETLIFDEADQGVGGAVAAAIGERLAGLSEGRQVFAVTHSPQVASAASRQWRVMKTPDEQGQVSTRVAQLDDGQRLEEIARMLSGSSITDEARAAASKLLEAA